MKKPLLVSSSLALLMFVLSCQKSADVPSAAASQDEVMGCAGGGGSHEAPPPLECGVFRTQSQGGWGAYPYGNNSGTYLHTNFLAAFPSGLKIGCDAGGHSVTFTTASAITKFLPSSGYPASLTTDATDPQNGSIRNVALGQVTALALNVGFDFYDADFSPAEEKLGNLSIASGTFAGMSVSQFLSTANAVLGGCNTDYSVQAVNQTAGTINANFLDGKANAGMLTCPTTRFAER